jgi:ribonuclease HI
MALDGNCALCGSSDSWRHALLECNLAKCVWAFEREELTGFICQIETLDTRAWLAEVMAVLKHEELTRVVVRLWAVWYARRQALFESKFRSPFSTNSFMERFISELEMIKPSNQQKEKVGDPAPRWIKPPRGFAMGNVDAAISKNSSKASATAVSRDEEGNFLGASVLVLEGCADPETVEVMACREGLALASDLDLQTLQVASDCVNAVRNIHGEGFGRYGPIVWEINSWIGSFTKVEFIHEGRRSNVDAHCLARSSVNFLVGIYVWFVAPPDGICTSYPNE